MSRVLISKRVALDIVAMQRTRQSITSGSLHHRKTLLLGVARSSIQHLRPAGELEENRDSVFFSSSSSSSSSTKLCFHCKQSVTQTRNGGIPNHFVSMRRGFHTAASPGSDSQVLFSTRWGSFTSHEDARRQVAQLSDEERNHLEKAIADLKKVNEEKLERESEPPTWKQLRLLCYQNALPFIGFGFLDNVIMICVGEYIDTSIGVTLGISTMAAAGIGNMISDLAGLGLADQVEALCRKLGIPNPELSSIQLRHRSSRWMGLIGRCVGIIIGCTIGMAPLLWFDDPHKDDDHETDPSS